MKHNYLSPLLFCFAITSLPREVSSAAPHVVSDVYADDYTLASAASKVDAAASQMSPAIQALTTWGDCHYMVINMEKGKPEGMVLSFDPRETAGKAQPPPPPLLQRQATS